MGASISYSKGTIVGSEFDDYLYGTDNGEGILGFDGNDWLRGNGGSDSLYGDAGNDLLEGGAGNDRLDGGLHNDTASYFNANHGVIANLVFGTAKTLGAGPVDDDTLISIENLTGSYFNDYFQGDDLHNKLEGMAGDDVLLGWGGDDLLLGGFGADYVVGGEGQDTVSGGFDADTLYGGNGFDTVDYSYAYQGMKVSLLAGTAQTTNPAYYTDTDSLSGFERVVGTNFDDILEGDGAGNTLVGGFGADRLVGLGGNDTLDGGDGDDWMDGGAGADAFYGGAGTDSIDYQNSTNVVGVNLTTGFGNLGDALWDTYSGMENIFGSNHAAGDLLIGNSVANIIVGNGGNDVIRGMDGKDHLEGGSGRDLIEGGQGDDLIYGGDGDDIIDGGAGFDTVNFAPGFGGIDPVGEGVIADLRDGTVSGLGNDGETIVNVEAMIGTSFDDILAGSDVRNIIRGGLNQDDLHGRAGDDHLYGDDGADNLVGDAGNDWLYGGRGRDLQAGGAGEDVFVFTGLTDTGVTAATRDTIRDFEKGEDRIHLTGIDAKSTVAGNQAFLFIDDDAFSGAAGQLRSYVSGTNTFVEGDINGDRVADFQIHLNVQVNLSALDFFL